MSLSSFVPSISSEQCLHAFTLNPLPPPTFPFVSASFPEADQKLCKNGSNRSISNSLQSSLKVALVPAFAEVCPHRFGLVGFEDSSKAATRLSTRYRFARVVNLGPATAATLVLFFPLQRFLLLSLLLLLFLPAIVSQPPPRPGRFFLLRLLPTPSTILSLLLQFLLLSSCKTRLTRSTGAPLLSCHQLIHCRMFFPRPWPRLPPKQQLRTWRCSRLSRPNLRPRLRLHPPRRSLCPLQHLRRLQTRRHVHLPTISLRPP